MLNGLQAPQEEQPSEPLPALKKELKFYLGPPDLEGAPTYNIHDPIASKFYQINWDEGTLLQSFQAGMSAKDLNEKLKKNTTLRVEDEDISAFFDQASKMGLTQKPLNAEEVEEEFKKGETSLFKKLIHNYLYFKVPLTNPDIFLGQTIHIARALVSKTAILIYVLVAIAGLLALLSQYDAYFHTFPYFFSVKGAIAYSVTMAVVKMFHEAGHAYTAKHYGVRVPAIGFAFLVLQPRLYTDVTDSWKLSSRLSRLHIDAAGILSELILAGIATLLWALSDEGIFKSAFFLISSVTLIQTVLINFNPAMRFDGYYLLSDFLGVDNLQSRAFAYSRWQLRKWFLGMNAPAPEEGIPKKTKVGMMLYSLYTWIYRIVLYTGIVLFVYYEFTKIIGILLALVEIIVFILRPFWDEAKQIFMLRNYLTINPRSIAVFSLIFLSIAWFIIPLPHTETFSAVVTPSHEQIVYIPSEGKVYDLTHKRGDFVTTGTSLFKIDSFPLRSEIRGLEVDIEKLNKEVQILSEDDKTNALIPEKQANIAAMQAQLSGLLEQRAQLHVKSTVSGVLFNWDLKNDTYVYRNQEVGKIADPANPRILCFVPESKVADLKEGQEVRFLSNGDLVDLKGVVNHISPVRASTLSYPQLGSFKEGPLPVAPQKETGKLNMVDSYYQVEVSLIESNPIIKFGLTGQVLWQSAWRSKLFNLLKYLQSIFWKESGF